jgi:hypothetical protein
VIPPAPAIDAIGAPDRLTIAVAEAASSCRAMPLAPADMALARPDLWATPKAAERHLEARAGDQGFGGFKDLIRARYRKGLRGRWSTALVPVDGGRAALEEIVGPVTAYQVDGADAAPPNVAAAPEHAVPPSPVPLAFQAAQLVALAQRLDAARPRRSWGERLMDWQAHQTAARMAAGLSREEWQEWRAMVPAALDAVPPPITQMVSHDRAVWPDHRSMGILR